MRFEMGPAEYFCCVPGFRVNGVAAMVEDFVDQYDHDPENAPDYGCGDMRCDPKDPSKDVMRKYGISVTEYNEIVQRLCEKLDFGYCNYCV